MNEPTPFEKRAREVLDESTTRLDGRTLSRLTQARHAALTRRDRPAPWWRTWMPAGAATAAAVLAVMVWTHPGVDPGRQLVSANAGGAAFEDIDLLADAPDFVGDEGDVEFYEWASGEIES